MTALAIPELIVPGELYIPDGFDPVIDVTAGALPNTNDTLTVVEGTETPDLKAYQDSIGAGTAARAPHLLIDGACALSFWIRRRAVFDNAQNLGANTVNSSAVGTAARFIMGVMDPTIISAPATNEYRVAWFIGAMSASAIALSMAGYIPGIGPYWYTTGHVSLNTDQWHFVVFNREPATFLSAVTPDFRGRPEAFRDANSQGAPNYSNWSLFPNSPSPQRFSLGDGTQLGQTAGTSSAGPAWDIAKVCFHDQALTTSDQLDLIESMKYGPGA